MMGLGLLLSPLVARSKRDRESKTLGVRKEDAGNNRKP